MVFTSDAPITVDGVRLDTLAWNITKVSRSVASRRSADVEVPGADGTIPSLNDPLAAVTMGLELWLRGTDADGAVPGGLSRRSVFWQNLDELVHLFGKRHGLIELTETVAPGQVRRTYAKVTDTIQPDVNEPGSAGTFSVALTIPAGVWEDVAAATWDSGQIASGDTREVTTLQGATERCTDALVCVRGPINNPRLTDPATGSYVQLNRTVPAGEDWTINLATWTSRYGAALGLNPSPTVGNDGAPITVYGGARGVAQYLTLQPTRTSADPVRRTRLTLTGTGGITTATRVFVQARRKFAL